MISPPDCARLLGLEKHDGYQALTSSNSTELIFPHTSSSSIDYRSKNAYYYYLVAEGDGGVNLDPTLPESKRCRGRGGHQQQLAGGGGQEHHPGDHGDHDVGGGDHHGDDNDA